MAVDVVADRGAGSRGADEFEALVGRGRSVRVPVGFVAAALSRLLAVPEMPC